MLKNSEGKAGAGFRRIFSFICRAGNRDYLDEFLGSDKRGLREIFYPDAREDILMFVRKERSFKKTGQTVFEYAMLFIAVSLAVLGIERYLRRSVQGTLKLTEVVINDPRNWEHNDDAAIWDFFNNE